MHGTMMTLRDKAMFLAYCVRNEIEDLHAAHADLGTVDTITKLNQKTRNAIFTGLTMLDECPDTVVAQRYYEFVLAQVPDYWEQASVAPSVMDSDEFDWIEGAIDRSYHKSNGTKAEQVKEIATSLRRALAEHKQYRSRVSLDNDESWILHFDCGHSREACADEIREHGIWPFCIDCQAVRSIMRAATIDDLLEEGDKRWT